MGLCTKVAVPAVGTGAVIFWRAAVVALVAVLASRGRRLRPRNHRLLLVRSISGLLAMACYFYALGQIPLGTATCLLYTNPVFLVLFSGAARGERPISGGLPLALLAFAGVLLIVRPGAVPLDVGTIAGLCSGLLTAVAYLAVRRLRDTESAPGVVLYFALVSVVATLPFVLARPLPPAEDWLPLLGVGVFASVGQLAMTRAFHLAEASRVGTLSYATVVLSYALGLAVLGERLAVLPLMGAILVVAAGISLVRRTAA